MAIAKVKMTAEQFHQALSIINEWAQDKDLCDLIELMDTPVEELAHDIISLKVSGTITYDLWKKFCQEVGIQAIFPNF